MVNLIDSAAAEIEGRRRIVVAGDPSPLMRRNEVCQECGIGFAQPLTGRAVMEAVAEANDGLGAMAPQRAGKALEAGARVVRGQQGAMPGKAGALLEVKIGDYDGASA
jgi:hypothetical protein